MIKPRLKNERLVRDAVKLGWRNSVKCSHGTGETPEHRNLKWIICEKLYEWGIPFITEATLQGGGRADIVVEDWGVIIEVLHTERKKRFEAKNYPLPALGLNVKDDIVEVFKLLEELRNTTGGAVGYYIRLQALEEEGLNSSLNEQQMRGGL